MKKRKKGLVIGLLSVVIITLIMVIGGKLYMDNQESKQDESLSNQRLAAVALKKEKPYVTKVEFKGNGSRPGLGAPWVIGAKATMDGEVFDISLETEGNTAVHFQGNEDKRKRYEEISKEGINKHPLEVIYSNGEREVLK